MLVNLDTGRGGALGDASHEPSRLQHAVGRVEERGRVPRERSREILAPLRSEAGARERFVLVAQLVALLVVYSETEAAGRAEGIAGEDCQLHELRFRPTPERGGRVVADRVGQNRVRRRATPQRKAPVAPARATGDLASLEQAHAHSGLR